ncbi:MAG: hypothetical protein ACR2MY_06870 [Candidatus Dormibacteria bacterium]
MGGLVADPDALARLAQRFTYVVPDPLLLAVVRRYSPIVEIGAGTGYWAYLLRLAGADVVAYDQHPPGECLNRYHPDAVTWSAVLEGDAAALAAHTDRALFICWPPAFSSLGEVLFFYRGEVVIYVGDRGPRTAWLTGLERDYELVERHDVRAIDPEPGTRPELSVWARRVH